MLTQEMVVTIQVLKKRGQSIKAISREMGISRNTVKKYLNSEDTVPQYQLTNGHLELSYQLNRYRGHQTHLFLLDAIQFWIFHLSQLLNFQNGGKPL